MGSKSLWPAACLLVSGTAMAHPDHAELAGFAVGFCHPWLGVDHVLALLAAGALSGVRRSVYPATGFLLFMALGLGLSHFESVLRLAEWLAILSVVGFGYLLLARTTWSAGAAAVATSLFAVFHGILHGAEKAADMAMSAYAAGLLSASATLLIIGVLIGLAARRNAAVRRSLGLICLGVGAGLFVGLAG